MQFIKNLQEIPVQPLTYRVGFAIILKHSYLKTAGGAERWQGHRLVWKSCRGKNRKVYM